MGRMLVTGATGFVGQHLCAFLAERGYAVRGTLHHRQPSATVPAPVEWVDVGDIGPDTDWSAALDQVQYVIHLAALAHTIGVQGEGRLDEFMRVNAAGTRRLAEAVAAAPGVRRFVFVSSVGAVTSRAQEVITTATLCAPDQDYGRSKRAAERAVEDVLGHGRADWCVVRPTLVYGPGNPGNMARLLKLIDIGLPLPLAAVRNHRSFLFVGNLIHCLERCATHPGASRRFFLVSDGPTLSTPELIRRLARHSGKPLRLFPLPPVLLRTLARVGNQVSRLVGRSVGLDTYSLERLLGSLAVDSSALQMATGWQPPFSMDEGLAATFRHATAPCPLRTQEVS